MSDSLLPANASALERAFERAFQELLYDVEAPFPQLLDPQRTPVALLPYLANDRGVSEWVSDAEPEAKRRIIASAWPMQRLAGTREALERALALANLDATFYPWHATGGAPFTLEIRATSDVNQTPDDYRHLAPRIADAKAERDTITIRVEKTIPLEQRLRFAQVTQQAHRAQIAPAPIEPIHTPPGLLAFGGATQHAHRTCIAPAPVDPISVPVTQLTATGVVQSARRWALNHPVTLTAEAARQTVAGVIRAATIMTIEDPING